MFWNDSDRFARQLSALALAVYPALVVLYWISGILPFKYAALALAVYVGTGIIACALWVAAASLVLGAFEAVVSLLRAASHALVGHRHTHA